MTTPQSIIDEIIAQIWSDLAGAILLWSGAIVDIPDGWILCDGNNGSPDLRDKFVVGAGGGYSPDDTGGSLTHTHDGTTDGHNHASFFQSPGFQFGAPDARLLSATDTFTTDPDGVLPPYFALAYIMKT